MSTPGWATSEMSSWLQKVGGAPVVGSSLSLAVSSLAAVVASVVVLVGAPGSMPSVSVVVLVVSVAALVVAEEPPPQARSRASAAARPWAGERRADMQRSLREVGGGGQR